MEDYNIDNPKIIQGLTNELNFIVDNDNSKMAEDYYFYLDKILSSPEIKDKLSGDLLEMYQKMVIKAEFIALPRLSESQIYNLFSKYLTEIFSFDSYDLWRKLKIFLSSNNSLAERDRIKENIRKILNESQLILTNKNLIIKQKEEPPTVANWLKDYRTQFGEDGFLDNLKFTQYLINSDNVQNLSENEKSQVSTIFNFYRRIKLSSLTNEGLEEDITIIKPDGEMGNLKEGKFDKIDKRAIDLSNLVDKILGYKDSVYINKKGIAGLKSELLFLQSNYPAGSIEHKAIEEEIEKMEGEGGK